MKTVTSVKIASLLLGIGLLTGGAHLKAVTCADIRAKEKAQQVLTSQDVTQKGKCLAEAIAQWSGAAGAKSIFMSAKDTPNNENIVDGNNYLPETTVQRTTGPAKGPRIAWIQDLYRAQSYLKRYAPNSDGLKSAWSSIHSADIGITAALLAANAIENMPPQNKVVLFDALIPQLESHKRSLEQERTKLQGIKMWFYDTQASKDLVLKIIPVIIGAIDHILADSKQFKTKNAQQGVSQQLVPVTTQQQEVPTLALKIAQQAAAVANSNKTKSTTYDSTNNQSLDTQLIGFAKIIEELRKKGKNDLANKVEDAARQSSDTR